MRLSKNFILPEFVPRDMYEAHGDKCIHLIDDRIIHIAQLLRDEFGVMVANTWHNFIKPNRAEIQQRGWRPCYLGRCKDLLDLNQSDHDPAEFLIQSDNELSEFYLNQIKQSDHKSAEFSAHKFGRAIDLVSPKRDTEEMRQHIIDHHKEKFSIIRRIENKVGWLHVDVANTMTDELIIFDP
tara:strand:+ start:1138 stop:1683 length:546 start_codon:yes stop_codon:yes gene_type:complete